MSFAGPAGGIARPTSSRRIENRVDYRFAGFGWSLHFPLNSLPRCSATIAEMPITPITRKIRKKTTAITRTGIPHLWSHSAWVLNLASVIAITGGCELCGDSGRRIEQFQSRCSLVMQDFQAGVRPFVLVIEVGPRGC